MWTPGIVVLSALASCTVTSAVRSVLRLTACTALWTKCVRPSLISMSFASGVVRMRSIVARSLLPPLPVGAGQINAHRRRDVGCGRRSLQERVVAFIRVQVDEPLQRRIRFQDHGVNADCLAREHPGVGQPLYHPRQHRLLPLGVDPTSRARESRMVACRVVQRDLQKPPQAQFPRLLAAWIADTQVA